MAEALGNEARRGRGGRAVMPVVVYSEGDIPGLDSAPEYAPTPPQHAWGEEGGDWPAVAGPRGRLPPGGPPADSEAVTSILTELRQEQAALRAQVASQVEAMSALQEQAQMAAAERQRAQSELAAVRGRMASGGGRADALDHFIVETHILPKHVNAIPEDLEDLPGLDLPAARYQHQPRGARPRTPDQHDGHAVAARRADANRHRAAQIGSPAILRGDLPSKAPPGPSRIGSKIAGDGRPIRAGERGQQKRADKAKSAGASRWK